jgi:hypothetical protein
LASTSILNTESKIGNPNHTPMTITIMTAGSGGLSIETADGQTVTLTDLADDDVIQMRQGAKKILSSATSVGKVRVTWG